MACHVPTETSDVWQATGLWVNGHELPERVPQCGCGGMMGWQGQKSMKIISVFMPVILASLVIIARYHKASGQPIPSDDSLLTQQVCQIPCWYALVPGISRLQDVLSAIPDIDFVSQADGYAEGQVDDNYVMRWWYSSTLAEARLTFSDNILNSIEVHPNVKFTLDDILAIYKNPDAYRLTYQLIPVINEADLSISLYYPSLGLVVDFDLYEGPVRLKYELSPDATGTTFQLYSPATSLTTLVADQENVDLNTANFYVYYMFVMGWPGVNSLILDPPDIIQEPFSLPTVLTPLPVTPSAVHPFTPTAQPNMLCPAICVLDE